MKNNKNTYYATINGEEKEITFKRDGSYTYVFVDGVKSDIYIKKNWVCEDYDIFKGFKRVHEKGGFGALSRGRLKDAKECVVSIIKGKKEIFVY